MVTKKKLLFVITLIIFSFIIFNIINFNKEVKVENTCLNNNFLKVSDLKLNSIYDFDKKYNCRDWDEILIVGGGSSFNRLNIYFRTGIVLPKYDYINQPEAFSFLFFLNKGEIVSNPIIFGGSNFIFTQNLKNNNLRLKRENAVFIYKRYENPEFELYTLEILQ